MDYLDIQLLKRHCTAGKQFMDKNEIYVVTRVFLLYFLNYVDVGRVVNTLHIGGYIEDDIYKDLSSGQCFIQSPANEKASLIEELTKRVGFVPLLWSLCTSGYTQIANCLLRMLNDANCEHPTTVSKLNPTTTASVRLMVSKLKMISDTRLVDDPCALIRKLSIRTKNRFVNEARPDLKARLADKYFAIMSVELDNFTFLNNKYLSEEALFTEFEHIIPFTTNPALNEALYLGRKAETCYFRGCTESATASMEGALSTMLNTVVCPEMLNIFYQLLNVLLRDYERSPSYHKKRRYLEIGNEGLRFSRSMDNEFSSYFTVSFMQRIAMCALDVGITGQPISSNTEFSCLETGRRILQDMNEYLPSFSLRKSMLHTVSTARFRQLTGDKEGAIPLLEKAEQMAEKCQFLEAHNIRQFKEALKDEKDGR